MGQRKINNDIFERLQLRFVNKFTSSMMVYGELGATPLDIDIKSRMLIFWARLCSGDKHKISNTIYSLLYTLDKKDIFKSEWIETVKTTLNNCGFSGLWLNHSLPCSIKVLKQAVKIRLRDQFIQKWHETIPQGCDEFHYLLCCPTFKEERKNFINSKYYRRPSTFYVHELFYQTKGENLEKTGYVC